MARTKALPPLPLKKVVSHLREMDVALAVKDAEDGNHGRRKNTTREAYRQALATAIAALNDYLFTGAPSSHWLKGEQGGIAFAHANHEPITAQNSGI